MPAIQLDDPWLGQVDAEPPTDWRRRAEVAEAEVERLRQRTHEIQEAMDRKLAEALAVEKRYKRWWYDYVRPGGALETYETLTQAKEEAEARLAEVTAERDRLADQVTETRKHYTQLMHLLREALRAVADQATHLSYFGQAELLRGEALPAHIPGRENASVELVTSTGVFQAAQEQVDG